MFLCIGIQNLLAYAVLQVNPYHWRSLSQFLVVFSLGKNQCSMVGVAYEMFEFSVLSSSVV